MNDHSKQPKNKQNEGNNTTNNNQTFNAPIHNSGNFAHTVGTQINNNTSVHNSEQSQTPPAPPTTPPGETINTLFVLANPQGSSGLRLSTEMRAIEEAFRLSQQRQHIQHRTLLAATANDLRRAMLDKPYQIVHIAGHGTTNGIMLEDDQGQPHMVSIEALAKHFNLYRQTLNCLILNACYTAAMGQRIALGIPYVIAMSGPIHDLPSIEFSRGFYDAIGAGTDIERAYLEGLSAARFAYPDHNFLALLLQE